MKTKYISLAAFASCLFITTFAQTDSVTSNKNSTSHANKHNQVKNGFGIKAGLNFANVTNLSSINGSSETGFNAGVFFGIFNQGVFGSRTELLYSQQGYGYSSDTTKGTVKLNYIMLVQMMGINISRFFQIQIGGQMGYMLTANVKQEQTTGNEQVDKILDTYNRFDYGLAGGIEVHPFMGFMIGARYTYSFNNLYKDMTNEAINNPSYVPSVSLNFKNNVVQLFVGYRF